MSDKFFFKGRQDARQDHAGTRYQTNAGDKGGSKKYPLALVVTAQARKEEIEAQAVEAGLHVSVTVDDSDGAEESVAQFTALLNKSDTVKVEKTPARNEPCSCGSGKKYKKCCG